MITRLWRGWTMPQNAEAYQALLLGEIFPSVEGRELAGYRRISLGRRNIGNEVEFIMIMWFDSLIDIKSFSGEDYKTAVVPPKGPSGSFAIR